MVQGIWVHMGALVLAMAMDRLWADPAGWPHPVCWMGRAISALERRWGAPAVADPMLRRQGGRRLVLVLLGSSALAAALLWVPAFFLPPAAALLWEACLLWPALAMEGLAREAAKVQSALEAGDLSGARLALSMVVGRDTRELDGEAVARACVETVAENTCDGVLAPLFFAALGGPVLAWTYKAVNTMDSMVAYQTPERLDFGRAAALTDDAWNWLPARLGGAAAVLAAGLCPGMSMARAWRVFLSDRRRHKSPNSGHLESAFAGALGLRLGGPGRYFGRLVDKPWIGAGLGAPAAGHIRQACRLLYATSLVWLLGLLGLLGLVSWALVG